MHQDASRIHDAPGDRERRIKRLRFRAARRGFKEADLVLGGFAEAFAASLDDADLARFEALLEEPDADIYAWAVGGASPPARHDHALLRRVRQFARTMAAGAAETGA